MNFLRTFFKAKKTAKIRNTVFVMNQDFMANQQSVQAAVNAIKSNLDDDHDILSIKIPRRLDGGIDWGIISKIENCIVKNESNRISA